MVVEFFNYKTRCRDFWWGVHLAEVCTGPATLLKRDDLQVARRASKCSVSLRILPTQYHIIRTVQLNPVTLNSIVVAAPESMGLLVFNFSSVLQ
jgi:hypothetical protein